MSKLKFLTNRKLHVLYIFCFFFVHHILSLLFHHNVVHWATQHFSVKVGCKLKMVEKHWSKGDHVPEPLTEKMTSY